jgi:glc operon protein GlcG
MITTRILSLDDAKTIAAAARAEAVKNNWTVVIAIVDEGGHLMYLERADGTQKASSVIAVEKAKTAILFKRPSLALEEGVTKGRIVMMSLPGAVTVEGGVPIVVDGQFVGAVGVSGVQSSQDGIVARAGVAAFTG